MKIGIVLLGIWLILMGFVQAFALTFPYSMTLLGILAIVAGIFFLLNK
jgi:hypothetical protein